MVPDKMHVTSKFRVKYLHDIFCRNQEIRGKASSQPPYLLLLGQIFGSGLFFLLDGYLTRQLRAEANSFSAMASSDEQKQQAEKKMSLPLPLPLPLEGRVAIVTGASRGIGRQIALNLAEKGAKVVVHYSSNQYSAEEVVSIINNSSTSCGRDGVRAIACKADVAEPSQVAQLFDMAEHTFGPIHIVVNNAGVLDAKYPTLAQTSDEDWDRTFQVNCKGAFLCSREAAKRVIRGGGGRIINITSSVVGQARAGYGAYSASKAAVEMMTRILAQELRGTQITANCVAPGPVATDMFFAGKSEAAVEAATKCSTFERLGKVEDVAPLVAFLASDEGEWVNAQVVRVNGGQV